MTPIWWEICQVHASQPNVRDMRRGFWSKRRINLLSQKYLQAGWPNSLIRSPIKSVPKYLRNYFSSWTEMHSVSTTRGPSPLVEVRQHVEKIMKTMTLDATSNKRLGSNLLYIAERMITASGLEKTPIFLKSCLRERIYKFQTKTVLSHWWMNVRFL